LIIQNVYKQKFYSCTFQVVAFAFYFLEVI
jgi:hypothetical protein